MEENEFKARFQALLDAIKTGDSSEIERKKVRSKNPDLLKALYMLAFESYNNFFKQ